ncbi:hypothetical protein [Actinacidiphila paucisporea]|uniref:Lipoprotein n=1 Tax=Actinacidiphila paucisporea TaxID=310782 RepID=A0A1M6UHQ3_9ACTN|nr:hypothetical protein [Actinacidiphila paucisporea]SHK68785.1 hypothetical protein SAMN05216499_101371 [Actinacidiphila paucisporea]
MGIRHRGTTTVAVAAVAALTLAACGGGGGGGGGKKADGKTSSSASATQDGSTAGGDASPSVTPTQILAQIKGEQGITVVINSAVRDADGFVTVQGSLTNNGDSVFNATTWRGPETALIPSGPSVAGAVLVDEAGKKRYYVLRDTDGKCLCTMGLTLIQPEETRPIFAQFPSPPSATTQVEFELPTMPPAKITISDSEG